MSVPLPPVAEQERITSILGALDDKIELNWKMSATLEAMARAIFKSWFVDFDPVHAKAAGRRPEGMDDATAALFPDRFGDDGLPEGWRRRKLEELVAFSSGGTPSKSVPALWGGGVPWISPKVMTEIHVDSSIEHVTPAAIGNGTRLAPAGSTLVMVRGMGLHERVRVSQACREVTFNQDVKALVPCAIDPDLLLFTMLHAQDELLRRVESSGHGTGRLPSDVLGRYEIAMPNKDQRNELPSVFNLINKRMILARNEARTLTQLRDLLLPRLISGKLPILEAERVLEAAIA